MTGWKERFSLKDSFGKRKALEEGADQRTEQGNDVEQATTPPSDADNAQTKRPSLPRAPLSLWVSST